MCYTIMYIGSAIIGGLLAKMGYGLTDWQFWLILLCYVSPNVARMVKDHMNKKGG